MATTKKTLKFILSQVWLLWPQVMKLFGPIISAQVLRKYILALQLWIMGRIKSTSDKTFCKPGKFCIWWHTGEANIGEMRVKIRRYMSLSVVHTCRWELHIPVWRVRQVFWNSGFIIYSSFVLLLKILGPLFSFLFSSERTDMQPSAVHHLFRLNNFAEIQTSRTEMTWLTLMVALWLALLAVFH